LSFKQHTLVSWGKLTCSYLLGAPLNPFFRGKNFWAKILKIEQMFFRSIAQLSKRPWAKKTVSLGRRPSRSIILSSSCFSLIRVSKLDAWYFEILSTKNCLHWERSCDLHTVFAPESWWIRALQAFFVQNAQFLAVWHKFF